MAQCRYGLSLFSKLLPVINNHPHSAVSWPFFITFMFFLLNGPQFAQMRPRSVLCLSFNDVHELSGTWEEKEKNIKKPTLPKTWSYSQTESKVCGCSFHVQIKSNPSLPLSFSCFIMQNSQSSLVFSSELCIAKLNSNVQTDLKPGRKKMRN